jgi:hypothetical protein
VRFRERLLDGKELLLGAQRLDGLHVAPVGLDGEHQARSRRFTVDQYGARAAHPMLAPNVRPRQLEVMPEEVAEKKPRLDGTLDARSVDRHRNGMHREIVRPGTGVGEGPETIPGQEPWR